MSEALPNDLWTPYKKLLRVVDSFLTSSGSKNSISNLDSVLLKNEQNFLNLLTNPPKNAKSRDEILHGVTEGVTLAEHGSSKIILNKNLVDETLILSNMYNLNEYIALELMCTAKLQMPYHPGLPRGLVAVLLYYDGRKTMATILEKLFKTRSGLLWSADIPKDITNIISNYTDKLINNNILGKIMECLEEMDITKEIDILTNSAHRALGPPKHRHQVQTLFEETRLSLATTLFNCAAQCGLPLNITKRIIDFLAKNKLTNERGGPDDVTLALVMALIHAIDLSALQKHEDYNEIVKKIPMVSEPNFAESVIKALSYPWECDGLLGLVKFAMGISIATLRSAPQNLQTNALRVIDLGEQLVDEAIQSNVFDFMHYTLYDNKSIFSNEYYFQRIHCLLTDFINVMHSKVTELRARADETAKTVQCYMEQGIEPPSNLCHNFENLLLAVGKLYAHDKLKLSLEYWGPMEVAGNYQRNSSRSVSLFKFIRLAGELLPPILFIPYLEMLSGLSSCQQSARNTYNLLKQGSGLSGRTSSLWDHFFNSLTQYYINLRQEQNPNSDTIYRNRTLSRNISPQELAGLRAVLLVIRSVAEHDEVARIALCQHPTWSTLNVLTGLVTCSCDIALKSDLLLTLSALGKSKETALQLWNILEASQIIQTVPSTSTITTGGIESELEQIESRNEIYPLTQAILDLLYTLTTTAVPKNLGAGPRTPGLDPYFTFILNTVFLRFYDRSYKNPAEKWAIAEKCLKLLDTFIKSYEPSASDFPVANQMKEDNSPPGFHVMLQMNVKSDLLRLILHIIDESITVIEDYTAFAGKALLESSVSYCLSIIEKSLSLQKSFFDAHFATNCSTAPLLTGINKLLLEINPRTGQACDYMLKITKFVCFNDRLSKQALMAVRILNYVLRQPNVNKQLISVFTSSERTKNEIRYGFVECMEKDTLTINDGQSEDLGSEIELTIKEEIINLLQECLPQPAPNVAHYLLGFDISNDMRSIRQQTPGMNFSGTCTNSLINVLDGALEALKSPELNDPGYERMVSNAYNLLHILCYNYRTSEKTLRYLRMCNDFLCRHITALPFENVKNPRILKCMTGLLKCVAIELKMFAAHSHARQFENLCKILLGVTQNVFSDFLIGNNASNMFPTSPNFSLDFGIRKQSEQGSKLLIFQLLDCIDFDVKPVHMPKWFCFENSRMPSLFKLCEITSKVNGYKLIDIKKLHDILRDELKIAHSIVAADHRKLLDEIEEIIKYALQLNSQKKEFKATEKFLEAWGQLTEVLFCVAPQFTNSSMDELPLKGLIIEIIQTLLNKVVPSQTTPELANLASSTVLLLMVNLRLCYKMKNRNKSVANGTSPQPLLNVSNASFQTPLRTTSNELSLKYILKNIVEWIILTGLTSQTLRMNLYASLLNYMHIIKKDETKAFLVIEDDFYVSRLDRSLAQPSTVCSDENANQVEMAIDVFSSFGDKFYDIICHDCTGGYDLCKMLAFSCVDMFLDIDPMSSFIHFISNRGYLSHLIDSLIKSDADLSQILETTPEDLKVLYVYEPKMAMLRRIASSYIGAELLLEHKILGILSAMRVFDLHPDFQLNSFPIQKNSFIPPIADRYRQILLPALNLCDVILSTLGLENSSAVNQIIHFLLSHGEMIEVILRAGSPNMDLGLLTELSAVTGLIARSNNQEIASTFSLNFNMDIGAHLYRLQKLMLGLLPRFILSESALKEMYKIERYESTEKNKSQHMKLVLQIACNLALYARNSIANYSADRRTIYILFSPNMNDLVEKDSNIGGLKSSPNLGLVVTQLKSCVEFISREKIIYDDLLRNRNRNLNDMEEMVRTQQDKLKLCNFLIEQCLYLLWAHVDYYMLRAVPVNNMSFMRNNDSRDGTMISAVEAGWKVTAEELRFLKKSLVEVLNDSFCEKVSARIQDASLKSDTGFNEALIRRIKQIVQLAPVN